MLDGLNQNHKDLMRQFNDSKWGTTQLRSVGIFEYLEDYELGDLYKLGQIKVVKPQSYAVIEGEPTRGLYIILSGTVSVYKKDKTKNTLFRLAYLEEGASFGELSLFDTAPRSASVAAESTCYLFYLDEKTFTQYLSQNGDGVSSRFYKKCAEDLVERFRKQNDDFIHSQQLLWEYGLKLDPVEIKKTEAQ